MKTKPIIPWPGGKSRLAKFMLRHVTPHTCYCEPFCGGLGFFLSKQPSKVEVINDLHGDLVNLYKMIKWHHPELLREMSFLVNSRELYKQFIEQPGLTEIQRAARWLYRCALGFGASDTSYGVQRKSGGGACSSLANLHPVIEALSARLDRVSIEHVDWARCVRLYDSAETFFFLDPPYSRCKTKNYAAWQDADMERLRDVLLGIQGSFLLTVNDCPENRRIFTCFRLRGISRQRGIANKTADQRKPYRELIIVPDQALSDRLKAA